MKTNIKKNGDTVIVNIDGKLDFESAVPFRENLSKIVKKTDSAPKKIIFNLEGLQFVGSSGISAFVQTLKDFSATAPAKPRYCNVKAEFQRVIKAFDEEQQFEFFDSEERAKKSYDQ